MKKTNKSRTNFTDKLLATPRANSPALFGPGAASVSSAGNKLKIVKPGLVKLVRDKQVMVFGTFDVFHKGHASFLKQAKKYGDYLIAVVARDKTVAKIKKQKPKNEEQKRKRILANSQLADKIILGSLNDKYAVIKKYRPDIICLGYDQKAYVDKLKDKLQEFNLKSTKIIRLKSFHPEKYKSSKLSFRA